MQTTLKANKAKTNDPITAQTVTPLTLKDGTVVPAGSTLLGHVVKVDADSTDQHISSIAVTFDAVELKKKVKLPLNLSVVSAMASAPAGAAGNNKMVSPSAGPLPYDHPLNGQAYNVVQDSPKLVNNPVGTQSALSGGCGEYAGESYRGPHRISDRIARSYASDRGRTGGRVYVRFGKEESPA